MTTTKTTLAAAIATLTLAACGAGDDLPTRGTAPTPDGTSTLLDSDRDAVDSYIGTDRVHDLCDPDGPAELAVTIDDRSAPITIDRADHPSVEYRWQDATGNQLNRYFICSAVAGHYDP